MSDVIVYLDETGDHSLELVDKDFPLFAISMFIAEIEIYNKEIVPVVNALKMDFFGHEAIVLHSRDIRKAQKVFGILTNATTRNAFCEQINKIMDESQYSIIASVIRKQDHKDKYGIAADNPYDLAMMFCLERLLPFLEERGQSRVQIIAESRGKKEDNDLMLSFLKVVAHGTYYNSAERFKKIDFRLNFVPKIMNVVGTQLADLTAYPIARYVHNPRKPNIPYDIVKNKIYRGNGLITGLKIFP